MNIRMPYVASKLLGLGTNSHALIIKHVLEEVNFLTSCVSSL